MRGISSNVDTASPVKVRSRESSDYSMLWIGDADECSHRDAGRENNLQDAAVIMPSVPSAPMNMSRRS